MPAGNRPPRAPVPLRYLGRKVMPPSGDAPPVPSAQARTGREAAQRAPRRKHVGRAAPPQPRHARGDALGVVLASELSRLRLPFVPGFLQDRRDLGVGDEALPSLRIPVEEHPDPVVLIGIAKHGRTFGPVLLTLLSALR